MSSNNKNTTKKKNTEKRINQITTKFGNTITLKQQQFIDKYMETGNARQAYLTCSPDAKHPDQYAIAMLSKCNVKKEIEDRMNERQTQSIATGQQVMEFFSMVMRGEIQDQFGLDAPLGERLKAANELAKRTVDIENRLKGNNPDNTIKLVIERRK